MVRAPAVALTGFGREESRPWVQGNAGELTKGCPGLSANGPLAETSQLNHAEPYLIAAAQAVEVVHCTEDAILLIDQLLEHGIKHEEPARPPG